MCTCWFYSHNEVFVYSHEIFKIFQTYFLLENAEDSKMNV